MSINTDQSVFNTTPVDVLRIIFGNLSLGVDIVALVCKTWKEVVDSETFREMIRPRRVMGIKQLIGHNPNIKFEGKEHPLPRKFYKEYATKGGLCFFNPGRVKLKIGEGEYELVVLNNLKAIASLFPNPNLQTRFIDDSREETLKEIREEKAPHWVWEEAKARVFTSIYSEFEQMAKEEDKALHISNMEDHVLGKFMAEAILGEREVIWDPNSDKYGLVHVNAITADEYRGFSICVAVAPSGLYVDDMCTDAVLNTGAVYARTFFGTKEN